MALSGYSAFPDEAWWRRIHPCYRGVIPRVWIAAGHHSGTATGRTQLWALVAQHSCRRRSSPRCGVDPPRSGGGGGDRSRTEESWDRTANLWPARVANARTLVLRRYRGGERRVHNRRLPFRRGTRLSRFLTTREKLTAMGLSFGGVHWDDLVVKTRSRVLRSPAESSTKAVILVPLNAHPCFVSQ